VVSSGILKKVSTLHMAEAEFMEIIEIT